MWRYPIKTKRSICINYAEMLLTSNQLNFSQDVMSQRKIFNFGKKENFKRWFPPHMSKGLVKMKENFANVDCVIEVHDARIPLSGRNPVLRDAFTSKPHILVLNKADLINVTNDQVNYIYQHFKQERIEQVLFTTCIGKNACASVQKIIPSCVEMVQNADRFNRAGDNDINLMIVGIPNVGKSSIINELRKTLLGRRAVAAVGRSPGCTKRVAYKVQVCDNPTVFLLDTPGIFNPKIANMEEGMKLAVCNTIHDHVMGASMVAEYLLFLLNLNAQHKYVGLFGLPHPTECIRSVLKHVAEINGDYLTHRIFTGTGPARINLPNYDNAATKFLMAYREGLLGKFVLDDV